MATQQAVTDLVLAIVRRWKTGLETWPTEKDIKRLEMMVTEGCARSGYDEDGLRVEMVRYKPEYLEFRFLLEPNQLFGFKIGPRTSYNPLPEPVARDRETSS